MIQNKISELREAIPKEEFRQWLREDCTRLLLYELLQIEQELLDSWKEGVFTEESAEGTAQKNAKALGQCQCVNDIRNLIEYLITEEVNDGFDSFRTSSIS